MLPKNKLTGVYSITNTANGKVYVGSCALHIPARWNQHRCLLRKGTHTNKHLQTSWLKYGESSFCFEVLELWDADMCTAMEQYWINLLRTDSPAFGYNMKPVCGSQLGFRHTDEAKQRISAHSASWERSSEHINALQAGLAAYIEANGHPAKGCVRTKEHLESLRMANLGNQNGKKLKGVVRSEEFKAKLRKPKSEATKAKMRGRVVSAETRSKQADAARNKVVSQETREKIRKLKTGVVQSAETRAKRSASLKAAWERRRNASIEKT